MTLNPTGLCECGCGEVVAIAKWDRPELGWRKGEPIRFRRGHSGRVRELEWSPSLWREEDRGHLTPCWIWLGVTDSNGYGIVGAGRLGMSRLAHRESYIRAVGPIPEGCEPDHLCRQPPCVNPMHLEPVPHAENIRRGKNAKLSYEAAEAIRALRSIGLTHRAIAERYGVSTRTISDTLAGKRWQHL